MDPEDMDPYGYEYEKEPWTVEAFANSQPTVAEDAWMDEYGECLVTFQTGFTWGWDALFFATIPALVVCVVTLIVVSLKTQKSDPPKPMLSAQGESMEDKPMFFWSKDKK